MQRTFIAIKINLDTKFTKIIHQLQKELAGEQISWVSEQNLHLTLAFLGDISANEIAKVNTVLVELTNKYLSFSLRIEELFCFKRRGVPSVIFLGIRKNEPLVEFVRQLDKLLVREGFLIENREYKPHLTIARVKHLQNKQHFHQVLAKLNKGEFLNVNSGEIILYESILKPSGAKYLPIRKYRLQ